MARYRSRLTFGGGAWIVGSAALVSFMALTHCGGDDTDGSGPTASADGGPGADGSGGNANVDGATSNSKADEYYRCSNDDPRDLEVCAESSPAEETCGSRDACSADTPCEPASCTCPGGAVVAVTSTSRCQGGCCTEIPTVCARACADVDAGTTGDAGSFDTPPVSGVVRVAPACTKWTGASSCGGRTICSYDGDAGCTPDLVACSATPTSFVPVPSCRSSEVGSSKTYASTCSPELHVVTVYESEDRARPEIPVVIERPNVPVVLALNAFQTVRWVVTVKENVQLTRIVVFNADDDTVVAPSGVPVTFLDPVLCAYDFADGNDCNATRAVVAAESVTGLRASSAQGCYYGASFALR